MSRVICDLPNASLEISGVRFQKLEDGRFISDEIGDEATAIFLGIPGYVLDEEEREEDDDLPPPADTPVAKTKAQLASEKKKAGAVKTPVAKPVVEAPVVVEPVAPVVETPPVDPAAGNVDLDAVDPAADPAAAANNEPATQEGDKVPDVF